MIRKHSKISIIGAGAVGATTAYSIVTQKLVSEVVIIDVNKDKAEGEAMDISHGLVAMEATNIHAGEYSDIVDSDIIIITAGIGRKPGETRLDLAKKNVGIAKDIAANIMKYYNGGVIMVVSNPVDIMTYVIQKESGLPAERVFGTGAALDSARFRYLLSEKIGVDLKNIHGFIAGEHGDSQFAVWSSVHISGMSLDSYCKKYNICIDREEIEKEVIYSGAEVIKRKGATYYAIASVVSELCNAILKNKKSIYNVSTILDESYGLDRICISTPSIVGINGVEKSILFDFSDDEFEKLAASVKQLKGMIDSLGI
ncbi:MAG: L-lactate dehydrogenase [Clostridia bacterium]|nr:L-lactate dehydrogenase [Clostridia bacterium]